VEVWDSRLGRANLQLLDELLWSQQYVELALFDHHVHFTASYYHVRALDQGHSTQNGTLGIFDLSIVLFEFFLCDHGMVLAQSQ